MIIWSGRGILIPFVFVFACLLSGLISGPIGALFGLNAATALKLNAFVSILGGSFGLLLFAKTIGKTTSTMLMDPQTGRRVQLARKHTFFFLTSTTWAVLSGLLSATVWFAWLPDSLNHTSNSGGGTGWKEFKSADGLLIGRSKGLIHGNCDRAMEFAKIFSRELKTARETIIESRLNKSAISLTGGEFLTYCLLTKQRCVFMVHVPDLRKFTSEAKDGIAEVAWVVALKIANEGQSGAESVAVGLRGSMLYDRVIVGRNGALDDAQSLISQIANGDPESQEALANQFLSSLKDDPYSFSIHNGDMEPAPITSNREQSSSFLPSTERIMAGKQNMAAPSAVKEEDGSNASRASHVEPQESKTLEPPADLFLTRTWTDIQSRTMKAAFIRFVTSDKKQIEFKREDNQTFIVPLERLSAKDQELLKLYPEPIDVK